MPTTTQEDLSSPDHKDIKFELLSPEGHEDVGQEVVALVDKVLKDKQSKNLPERWNRNYRLRRAEHWKTPQKHLVTANLLHTHRQRVVNLLTDNSPTFDVVKMGNVDDQKLLLNRHAAEHWWREEELDQVYREGVDSGETYGSVVHKLHFDDEAGEFGLGEVVCERVDNFHFGMIPVNCRDIQKAEAVLEYGPMPILEARRRWPEVAHKIKPEAEVMKKLQDERDEPGKDAGVVGRTFGFVGGVLKGLIKDTGSGSEEDDEVFIIQAWVKDYTQVEYIDEKGGKHYADYYPGNIRYVIVCNLGMLVLEDKPNPSINPELDAVATSQTYLYKRYPFIFTQSLTDPDAVWSQGDYEQLEDLQQEINKTITQITLVKDRASRAKLINPKDSGVSNEELTNSPGIINPTNSMVADSIKYMENPPIPEDLLNALNIYRDLFYLISGAFDIEQAETPGKQVIAYQAIAALIERATTQLRDKIKNYSRMIREIGRMWRGLAANYYVEPRWISFKEDDERVSTDITGAELIIPGKLTVVTGSMLPKSRAQEKADAVDLYKEGALSLEGLHIRLETQDRQAEIRRLSQGPLSKAIDQLAELGYPEHVLETVTQATNLKQNEFDKEVEKGRILSFPALMRQVQGMAEPMSADDELTRAKTAHEREKASHQRAETALVYEKLKTEQAEQMATQAGVAFDERKLQIEASKTLNDIEAKEQAEQSNSGPTKSKNKKTQGPHDERGMKSNNKKKAA